ncbi:cupin domain-containing protein [Agromyces salentinus]|uniref:Cupin type-2 domain-containing protein n=1 Tax=Agromyces salentinus TaxID=269421 RepID=A0ABP4YLJ4_9MICO|nr:cupin domain-containing protein [Agromyces salentinus]
MHTSTTHTIVRAATAETLADGPTSSITLLADGEHTAGATTINRAHLALGSPGAPAHRHENATETIFVIDGSLDVLIDDEVHTLTAGDLVFIDSGTAHAFAPTPGSTADMLAIYTPGQERFAYYRMLQQFHLGEITLPELQATSDRFDNHYVDSPVWRARA